MSQIELKPFGLVSVMVDCPDLQTALAVHAHLKAHPPRGAQEFVPAAQTVLVRFDSVSCAREFRAGFRWDGAGEAGAQAGKEQVIEVFYDGDDLAEVAQLTDLSTEAVVRAHTEQVWTVAFAGFAPGFFYLHAEDNALKVPRRSSPRTAVPAGAVGLAGDFSGVYPRTSPGGWQLIGRTAAPLWDLKQDPPALLEPGQRVKFKSVRESIEVRSDLQKEEEVLSVSDHRAALTVTNPGAQLLIQDSGRFGLTHWGVSPSGFADETSARDANFAVGNRETAPVLESLMGGFTLQAQQDSVLALTGAEAFATIAEPGKIDMQVPAGKPFALLAGQKLHVGLAEQGLRVYCALRGGVRASVSAESVSYDTLSGIGSPPLAAGASLAPAQEQVGAVQPIERLASLPNQQEPTEIRVIAGPRDDWFTPESLARFTETTWQVTAESNRIGARLKPAESPQDAAGAAPEENGGSHPAQVLERKRTGELASEGMVTGAIQVPPNGEPVVFLADRPVTGGYPVIATVHPHDLRLVAQATPGSHLRFTYFPLPTTDDQGESRA